MTDTDRLERNRSRLLECNPVFRARLAMVLINMTSSGFRPRIQQSWRSQADEVQAHLAGHSDVLWGFHNAVTAAGLPDALAADVLDDDYPISPGRVYVMTLARAARLQMLSTGILWGLQGNIRTALDKAIETGADWIGPIGWDPCHTEIVGLTIQQARAGMKPQNLSTPPSRAH